MIVRRRRNNSGEVSEWLIIPVDEISRGVVRNYWTVDLSNGISIIPRIWGDASLLRYYEMEESFETLMRCIKEAYCDQIAEMMYEYMNEGLKEM